MSATADLVVATARALGSLFAMIGPLTALPIFLSLTRDLSAKERRLVAMKSVLVAALILVGFAAAGSLVFGIFGITLPAFEIGGGLLILKSAWDLLHGERPQSDGKDAEIARAATSAQELAITPLATPVLAGPGAIAAVMVLVGSADGTPQRFAVYGCILVVLGTAFLLFSVAGLVERLLRPSVQMVTSRLLGLLLAAVGVQFIADGVRGFFP